MDFINKYSGVVALVILAIMGMYGTTHSNTNTLVGSSTNCTSGYTCFTNLEIQGNQITDGTATFAGALTFSGALNASSSLQVTGPFTAYNTSTLTGTTTITQSLLLRDADGLTCIDGYATSTATPVKFVFTATTTIDGQSTGAGILTFNYGTCS